jgi:hypothetical protein
MTRIRTPVAFLVVALAAPLSAQPDYSGRWNLESPAGQTQQDRRAKHDGITLTVTVLAQPYTPLVFKLDGTETRTVTPARGGDIVTVTKGEWTGGRLTLTSTRTDPIAGRKVTEQQVWALRGYGAELRLIIELSETQDTMPPKKTTLVFKRGISGP